MPVEDFGVPQKVVIPLQQHIGTPCEPLVKKGDDVIEGQLIGESDSFVSAKIHASISGKVTAVLPMVNPQTNLIIRAIEITSEKGVNNDQIVNKDRSFAEINSSSENINSYSKEVLQERFTKIRESMDNTAAAVLIEKIKKAGVVGMGGATFPTHVKLSVPKSRKIDSVIINGCECEPYITADHRLMLEKTFELLSGIYIIYKILEPENVFIAIEDNKRDAIVKINRLIEVTGTDNIFKVVSLPSRYPMGAEKTLIKNILKRKVPVGGLPYEIGVTVNNVATAKAIYDAVVSERPLIERIVTVTGDIEGPRNLLVRIGTLIGDFQKYYGKLDNKTYKLIFGGPMTGFSVVNRDFPVTKGLSCILLKESSQRSESNCIRCGRCAQICPMNLIPLMYANYVKNNKFDMCRQYYIDSCIECGSCAFVCPASIPLVGYIKIGKAVLARH